MKPGSADTKKQVNQNMNPVLSITSDKERNLHDDRKHFSSLNNDILKDRTFDP